MPLLTEISEGFVYVKIVFIYYNVGGEKILANNLIVNLNTFFLETHTHHPPISF